MEIPDLGTGSVLGQEYLLIRGCAKCERLVGVLESIAGAKVRYVNFWP